MSSNIIVYSHKHYIVVKGGELIFAGLVGLHGFAAQFSALDRAYSTLSLEVCSSNGVVGIIHEIEVNVQL